MSTVRSTAARQRADPLLRVVTAIIAMVMATLVLSAVNPPQARADASSREEYFPMQPFFHDSCGITDDSYAFPAQLVEGSEEFISEGGDEIWRTTHRGEFGDYNVTDMHRDGVRKVVIAFVATDPTKVIGAPREGVDTYWIDYSQGPDAAIWSYTYNSEPCPTEGPITQPSDEPTAEPVPDPTATAPATPVLIEAPSTPPTPVVNPTPSISPTQVAAAPVNVTPPAKGELAATGSGLSLEDGMLLLGVSVVAVLVLFAATFFSRNKQSDK